MPNAIEPVSFDELNTLKGSDITTTLQAQIDAIGSITSLTNTHILVGNASNLPADVAMSGDATMANTGALTIANSAITNVKVSASAAIDFSKLAALSSGNILVGNGSNVAASVALSGDATLANTGAITVLKTHVVTNTQTDSYTLVLGDDGKLIIMNKGTANDLTIPLNATVAFPTGTQIAVQQLGAGQTTIVATGGVTTQAQPGLKISAQYGVATLIKVATDTWIVCGALSA